MWSVIRRHPITEASLETVLKFLRSHDNKISKDELPGKQYKWAHTAPLKIGKAKHGKITVLAQEKEAWKEVVPYEQIEKYCRNAILNPKSSVPLSRDAGYHILQKETVGISRRAFYAFLAKQEPLQLTRDRNQTMVKPGRPLEKRGYLELDLVEAKGKDIGTWLHHPVKDFYFITIIDRLTGWFEVGRALHKDADTISKKIRQLLKRMAKALKIEPSKFYIRSDSGSEFKAETQAVFKELKLKHKFVKSGNRIEKVNRDFQRTWYRLMRLGRGDLEELDQQAAAITNNLKSKVTGKTPLEALEIEDSVLSLTFNKHRQKAVKYKAPEIKVGDKVRHSIKAVTGKYNDALGYKSYRGKHWSQIYVVVKINRAGVGHPLTRYYVGGQYRYRDELLLVPEVDEATALEIAQRKFI